MSNQLQPPGVQTVGRRLAGWQSGWLARRSGAHTARPTSGCMVTPHTATQAPHLRGACRGLAPFKAVAWCWWAARRVIAPATPAAAASPRALERPWPAGILPVAGARSITDEEGISMLGWAPPTASRGCLTTRKSTGAAQSGLLDRAVVQNVAMLVASGWSR